MVYAEYWEKTAKNWEYNWSKELELRKSAESRCKRLDEELNAHSETDLAKAHEALSADWAKQKQRADAAEIRAEKAEFERDAYKSMLEDERPCSLCVKYTGSWNPVCVRCDSSTTEYRPQFVLRQLEGCNDRL